MGKFPREGFPPVPSSWSWEIPCRRDWSWRKPAWFCQGVEESGTGFARPNGIVAPAKATLDTGRGDTMALSFSSD
jgi:hypothetical protein